MIGRTAVRGIRRKGALNNLPIKLAFEIPERFANVLTAL
jgi:hypothetical protein